MMSKDQSNHNLALKDELQDDELNQVTGGRETITFEYGGLNIRYVPQRASGSP
jgi:bacteriocin-like protein